MKTRMLGGAVCALLALLTLAGCQTATGGAPVATAAGQAVMCDKCQTVWVQSGLPMGKGAVAYRQTKAMACPDCESAVTTFFKTGALQHQCKTCGGALHHCAAHEQVVENVKVQPDAPALTEDRVVSCGKCQTVWVRYATTINKTTVFHNEKVMECPDCRSAARNFLTTGKWEHTCTMCGDSLAACQKCK